MNQQLREFEKASGLEIYGLGAKRVPWERALGKYADLVVLEMLKVCEEHPTWTARMIGEHIKQHFEVEK